MSARGLFLVLADPSPTIEEEFNDWYDMEHLPERAVIPGFETAQRFVCVSGGPKYAALYDLSSLAVLDSPQYRAVAGENFSPWTKRIMPRVRPERLIAERVEPDARIVPAGSLLLVLQFAGIGRAEAGPVLAGIEASFAEASGHLGSRVAALTGPEGGLLAISSFAGLAVPELRLQSFGAAADRMHLAALYRPYRRA